MCLKRRLVRLERIKHAREIRKGREIRLANHAFFSCDDFGRVVASVHDSVATEVLGEARGKRLGSDVILRKVPECPRELRLVRNVGQGLPSAKVSYGRRFADGGYKRRRVRVVFQCLPSLYIGQSLETLPHSLVFMQIL